MKTFSSTLTKILNTTSEFEIKLLPSSGEGCFRNVTFVSGVILTKKKFLVNVT